MPVRRRSVLAAALAAPVILRGGQGRAAASSEPVVLRISHHFPESRNDQGDFRDRLVRRFAADATARSGGALTFEIYPGATLVKPAAQFSGLRRNALDLTLCPLAFGAGEVPEAAIGMVPCLVTTDSQAAAWKESPAGRRLDAVLRRRGVRILTWAWLPCAFVSRGPAITVPADVRGLRVRSGSQPMTDTLKAAGAKAAPLLAEAISRAMRKGEIDAAVLTSTSLLSFRVQDIAADVTTARDLTCGYSLEPLMMSQLLFDGLAPAQQEAVTAAGAAQDEFAARSARADANAVGDAFAAAGRPVREMDRAALGHWATLAANTGWRSYAAANADCAELLRLALAVPA